MERTPQIELRRQAEEAALNRMMKLLLPPNTGTQLQEKFRLALQSGLFAERRLTLEYSIAAADGSEGEQNGSGVRPEPPAMPVEFNQNRPDWSFMDFARDQVRAHRRIEQEIVTVPQALERLTLEEYQILAALDDLEERSFSLEQTPSEIIVVGSEILHAIKNNPDLLWAITHRQFEEVVRDVLMFLGFDVELTAATRDGGCDLIGFTRDRLGITTKYVVEAKHYAPGNPVGVSMVRQLNTVRMREGAHHGVLITSSYFSPDAVRENKTYYGLHLNDYDALMSWISGVA